MKQNRWIGLLLTVAMIISTVGCDTPVENQTQSEEAIETDTSVVVEEEIPSMTTDEILTSMAFDLSEDNWIDYSSIYEVNIRQYTNEGTFNAFAEHLPRLQELGVKILWFMPIHPISEVNRKGTLGSYYAVADYKGVNPELGTEEDFKALVEQCHDMGFKVILDWVPNHTGWDNPWIAEHPDWYTQVEGEIIHPAGTDWTDVADLNYDNEEMRGAMIDALIYWIEAYDVDGFRCDVAGSVPTDFWVEASEAVNAVKPVFMLAEDGSQFDLLDSAFDANYHWNFMHSMNGVADGSLGISNLSSDMVRAIALYPEDTFPMNMVTNHDENSWNGTAFERLGDYKDLMTVLSFVAPGMPLIYSGQEASLDKRLLFFEKDEIDWSDLSHQELLEDLVDLKLYAPVLYNQTGGEIKVIKTTEKDVLVFVRDNGQQQIIFMGNFSDSTISFDLKSVDQAGDYRAFYQGTLETLEEGATFELDAYGYEIYISE